MRLFRRRSAATGRFVTEADAAEHPESTVVETVSDAPQVEANLRWRISNLEPALVQAADQMRRAAEQLREGDPSAAVLLVADRLARRAAEAQEVYDAKIHDEQTS